MKQYFSRKKNIVRMSLAVMAGSMFLTGCGGNVIPDMSDEEAQAVGEYAAMLVLRYDANHRSRLVDLSLLDESEEPVVETTPEPTPTPESNVPVINNPEINSAGTDNQSTVASIEQFFGLAQGVSISYTGSRVCDSYPDDGQTEGFFVIDASDGKKLLIIEFQMTNNSGSQQYIDIFDQKPACKVTVNGNYTRTALMTMLTNDMSTYIDTLEDGETENLILMIEVDQEGADSINTISLTLKNKTDSFITPLM